MEPQEARRSQDDGKLREAMGLLQCRGIDTARADNLLRAVRDSLSDRVVHIVGMTIRPDEAWMLQIGRNLLDDADGVLCG
jgi:hypothetical protein